MSGRQRVVGSISLVAAVVLIVWAANGLETVLAAMGLPFVLVLPGVALQKALFPSATGSESALLAISLGLGCVIVLGFVLNLTPGGLHATAWVISIFAVALVAFGVGLLRRPGGRTWLPPRPDSLVAVAMMCSVVILGSAFLIARLGVNEHSRPGFTQVWMLPGDTPSTVRIGVRNEEGRAEDFALRLDVDGQRVAEWSPLTLGPSQEWTTEASVPAREAGQAVMAEATLVRVDDPVTPYRTVHVRIAP